MQPSLPLNALRVFLVACRHRSFTAAAQELSVTHGAVSRQMKLLEDRLGQVLFEKEGLRMAPTAHALAFAEEIGHAFSQIHEASLHYGKGLTTRLLRVHAPATFAMKWLIPRLPDFNSRYPDARIQVQTATTQQLGLEGAFDLAIRRGKPIQSNFSGIALFEERHSLIASPELLQQIPLKRLEDIHQHVWISSDTRPRHWDEWLTSAGMNNKPWRSLRFDHFYVSYSAIQDGLGIGIGPIPTLSKDIEKGRIVTPFPGLLTPAQQYWAITPNSTQKTLLHKQFEEWLQEQITN